MFLIIFANKTHYLQIDTLAEWLRRQTRIPRSIGCAPRILSSIIFGCAGSNPAGVAHHFLFLCFWRVDYIADRYMYHSLLRIARIYAIQVCVCDFYCMSSQASLTRCRFVTTYFTLQLLEVTYDTAVLDKVLWKEDLNVEGYGEKGAQEKQFIANEWQIKGEGRLQSHYREVLGQGRVWGEIPCLNTQITLYERATYIPRPTSWVLENPQVPESKRHPFEPHPSPFEAAVRNQPSYQPLTLSENWPICSSNRIQCFFPEEMTVSVLNAFLRPPYFVPP